jgi:hypothetical protein
MKGKFGVYIATPEPLSAANIRLAWHVLNYFQPRS